MKALLPHQSRCVERGKQDSVALFLEMGLGKTRVVLELMPHGPSLTIVVCPISVKHTWEVEAALWRPDILRSSTIGLVIKKRKAIRGYATYSMRKGPTILVINYEQAVETCEWLKANGIKLGMVVADESTYIKSHKAQRTKAMVGYYDNRRKRRVPGIRDYARRGYILTGTPILQGPLDLYSQLNFVDAKIFPENYYAFRNCYAVMGGYERKQVVKYKNLDDLTRRCEPWVISIKKEDVALDLPPKIYVERVVDLTPKERKNYDLIKKEAMLSLPKGEFVPIVNALAKLAKMMQAANGFNYVKVGFKRDTLEYGSTKRRAAIELITDGDLAGQPVIIWSVFKFEILAIHNELVKAGVSVASEHSHKAPSMAAKAFIDGKANVLVLNPASMSHGVNLQRATAEVFLSNNFKYGDREQAEARCHRIGQKYPVTIVDIIADKTIDRKILKVLTKKGQLADVVLSELGVRTKPKTDNEFLLNMATNDAVGIFMGTPTEDNFNDDDDE